MNQPSQAPAARRLWPLALLGALLVGGALPAALWLVYHSFCADRRIVALAALCAFWGLSAAVGVCCYRPGVTETPGPFWARLRLSARILSNCAYMGRFVGLVLLFISVPALDTGRYIWARLAFILAFGIMMFGLLAPGGGYPDVILFRRWREPKPPPC